MPGIRVPFTRATEVQPVALIDGVTGLAPAGATYTLLTNAGASGNPVTGVKNGSYVWAADATNWNGATATLKALGPGGVAYLTVDTLTANGSKGVVLGEGATVRVDITGGPPTGVNSSLS